jgi:hypothetical protein
VAGCRFMLENALWKRISGGVSSRRVDLSRVMSGSVGVKIGVKGRSQIGYLSTQGCRQRSYDGPHGIAGCVRPVGACHVLLLPRLGITSQQNARRAVAQQDRHRVVVGLREEIARRRRDDLRDCDYPRTSHIHLKDLWHRSR